MAASLERMVFDWFEKREYYFLADVLAAEANLFVQPLNSDVNLPDPGLLCLRFTHSFQNDALFPSAVRQYLISISRPKTAEYMLRCSTWHGFHFVKAPQLDLKAWYESVFLCGPPFYPSDLASYPPLEDPMLLPEFQLPILPNPLPVVSTSSASTSLAIFNQSADVGEWPLTKCLLGSDVLRTPDSRFMFLNNRETEDRIIGPFRASFPDFVPHIGAHINVCIDVLEDVCELCKFGKEGDNYYLGGNWRAIVEFCSLEMGMVIGFKWDPVRRAMKVGKVVS